MSKLAVALFLFLFPLVPRDAFAQVVPGAAAAGEACTVTGRAGGAKRSWTTQSFRDRAFFPPLIADVRAPQVMFNFPAFTDAFPHSVKPGIRRLWDVSVGREIPIFTSSNFTQATVAKGCSGWGVWVDLSFHVAEELGKDESNPIINTDYRFSLGKVKYYRVLAFNKVTRTDGDLEGNTRSFAFRADILHHESTHLGDEYVIHAQALNRGFERFNPSYEFFDLTAGLNWEQDVISLMPAQRPGRIGRLTTVRGGASAPLKPSKGYYSHETLEPNPRPVQPSKRKFEPYVQFEHHWAHEQRDRPDPQNSTLTQTVMSRWSPFVSLDLRRRIVLNFYKTSADQKEDTQWSPNLLVGLRTWSGEQRFSIKEFYFRGYYGVNPAGQLRSVSDYWQVGLGVNFSVGNSQEDR